jgi:hypothetical protein
MKISGIWENSTSYGLTYKIIEELNKIKNLLFYNQSINQLTHKIILNLFLNVSGGLNGALLLAVSNDRFLSGILSLPVEKSYTLMKLSSVISYFTLK